MHSRLVSWSRWLYLAGIVLALVLVIPTAWFPFQLGKVAIFATLLAVAVVLYVVGRGVPDLLRTHGLRLALLTALLPAAYALSLFFSTDRSVGFIGFGLETDTVLFTALVTLAFVFSFTLFRTLRTARTLLLAVFWSLVAVVVFQWVVVIFGTSVVPFDAFTDRSVNLVGKWNDLAIAAGLLGLLVMVWGEFAPATLVRRVLGIVCVVAAATLIAVTNFSPVWGVILGFSLVLGIIAFLLRRVQPTPDTELPTPTSAGWVQRVPWFASAGVAVSILFLFFGSAFNTWLVGTFPVSSLEVRPSYSSTLAIVNDSHSSAAQALLGTGPNTFGANWLLHKPSGVNQTAFWNLDFNVGFSTVLTSFGSAGLLGALAWLVPALLVLVGFLRAVRLGVLSRGERLMAVSMTLASLFLITAMILYVPSQNIILLALALSGATFGFLWRQGRPSAVQEPSAQPSRLSALSAGLLAVVLLVVAVGAGYFTDRRLVAQAATALGAQALNQGDTDAALAYAAKASTIEQNNVDAKRLILQTTLVKLQNLANSTAPDQQVQTEFSNTVGQAVAAGKLATSIVPNDYRVFFALGGVYDFLASLNVQGAYDNALAAYQSAATLNPTSPAIPLALSRLEAGQGNTTLAEQYLSQSLTMKPNYTNAILFAVQLNVAKNDIPSAIQAAAAAAQTAPGVASIWFELGLLYYANNNSANAIPALEQAVTLVPDYANAKYFLGLSYYVQGRTQDAVQQFEDIQRTNPDNSEVQLILTNLSQGKDPLDGATPPLTPAVERPTAPVSE